MKKYQGLLFFLFFVIWSILLATFSPAPAETERITNFASEITVNRDASLTVKENIKVITTGVQIRHGIYRDFPVSYRDKLGYVHQVSFKILLILRDGLPESYHFGWNNNCQRIYIGKKDSYLSAGEHLYTIVYQTTRQLGFYEYHDELYWNVTGNNWAFPIEQASACVILPSIIDNKNIRYDGYTGGTGSQEKKFRVSTNPEGNLIFTTTRPLNPAEGFTIVVAWPKGLVKAPDKLNLFLENLPSYLAGLGVLLVLIYYLIVWFLFGRDPEKGVIIPLFEPPQGLSPAAVRYLIKMDCDEKTFAAGLINLAVKGFIKIKEFEGDYALIKTKTEPAGLSEEEKKIFNKFFLASDEIELNRSNSLKILSGLESFKKCLRANYQNYYFVSNKQYFYTGIILSLLGFLAAGTLSAFAKGPGALLTFLFLTLWLTAWNIGILAILRKTFQSILRFLLRPSKEIRDLVTASFLSLVCVPFIFGDLLAFSMFGLVTSYLLIPSFLTLILINFIFYHLIKRPTVLGRQLMNQIEGFKMYLEAAEKDRLNFRNPPQKTPTLFEKYLPYALALDVEQKWAEHFSDIIQGSLIPDSDTYYPGWYAGTIGPNVSLVGFTTALSGSFVGGLESASTPPGSSSGLGGGSSGGGGGGGGGGGW